MEQVECVVVGAGVVGIAVARALAQAGREVLVLEAAEGIGTGTSSRNSEVIHAGIYYAANSLMARLCVRGKLLLYDFCRDYGVPFVNCGKLIVATTAAEAEQLDLIRARAAANGVRDLRKLAAAEALALEPALRCTAALLSPSTGIVDSHAFMLAMQGHAEAAGAFFAFYSPVEAGGVTPDGFLLRVGGTEPMELSCRLLVNSAGLSAPLVARALAGMPPDAIPTRLLLPRGIISPSPAARRFPRLIYPVPEPGGLGVHLTLDLGGQARFGPDVEWIDAHRLHGRSAPRRRLLCRDPQILAGAAGRRVAAGLCRHPPEDRAAEPRHAGFRHPGRRRPTACRGWSTCSASKALA